MLRGERRPFQFGIGSLLLVTAVVCVAIIVPGPMRLFWQEVVWNGLSTQASEHAAEIVVGLLFGIVFCIGVGVGALLFGKRQA
jgi:hypothetical protein